MSVSFPYPSRACLGLAGDARGFVIKRVRQRDEIDVARQRRIDEEAYRQVAPLVESEVLGREAEAFGLVEIRGYLRRRDVGHRLRHGVTPGEVVRVELRGVELTRMHLEGAHHGTELPASGAGDVRQEFHLHGATQVRVLDGRHALEEPRLIAVAGD